MSLPPMLQGDDEGRSDEPTPPPTLEENILMEDEEHFRGQEEGGENIPPNDENKNQEGLGAISSSGGISSDRISVSDSQPQPPSAPEEGIVQEDTSDPTNNNSEKVLEGQDEVSQESVVQAQPPEVELGEEDKNSNANPVLPPQRSPSPQTDDPTSTDEPVTQ